MQEENRTTSQSREAIHNKNMKSIFKINENQYKKYVDKDFKSKDKRINIRQPGEIKIKKG